MMFVLVFSCILCCSCSLTVFYVSFVNMFLCFYILLFVCLTCLLFFVVLCVCLTCFQALLDSRKNLFFVFWKNK